MGKLVWWIYSKPDSLWVKWVHQIYLRGSSWSTHLPKTHMSVNWKAICRTRDIFTNGYSDGIWLADQKGYSIKSGYNWIRHKETKVGWAKIVLATKKFSKIRRGNIETYCTVLPMSKSDENQNIEVALPKYNFIAWLYAKERLLNKDRLIKHGFPVDDTCDLCSGTSETRDHMFFLCPFSSGCLQGLWDWLGTYDDRLLTKDRLIKHAFPVDDTCDLCSGTSETNVDWI
ncbi:uncharacterized protein LOC141607936 [Silene latifolia]|uniref:uncharacterized protein LOC141607936 n=1 Tax=Silene latifolia TaxID=37657 RepID=UPI003D782BA2